MTSEWTKPRPVNTLYNYGIVGTSSLLRASSNTLPAPKPFSWHTPIGPEDEVKEVDSREAVAVDEVVPDIPSNGSDEGASSVKAPSQERYRGLQGSSLLSKFFRSLPPGISHYERWESPSYVC